MNIYNTYLKQKKKNIDIFCNKKAEMYENIFNNSSSKSSLLKKKVLPYGWHWLYFSDNPNISEIGPDGHIKKGSFLPSFTGCKRMFAGAEVEFKKKIPLNSKVKKTSQIKKIENKSKNDKKIYFLTINHLYKVGNELVLQENQNLVFINKDYKSNRKILFQKEKTYLLLFTRNFSFNNIMLFKYSAITYNSHRIHYDIKYTMQQEGYKDLLVHGPLLAQHVIDEFILNIKKKLKTFEFKMLKPVLVNEKIHLKFFQNKEIKSNYKIIITSLKSQEVKFIANCGS